MAKSLIIKHIKFRNLDRRETPHMSFLSLYRPNFCSRCGEKIVRLKWRLWTSRLVCDECLKSFRKDHLWRQVIFGLAIFITGTIAGRSLKPGPPAIVIQRATTSEIGKQGVSTSTPQQPLEVDDAYTCGARTKKGSPCTRRVHGPVRCWQHKGLPPMLPQEKLKVK